MTEETDGIEETAPERNPPPELRAPVVSEPSNRANRAR